MKIDGVQLTNKGINRSPHQKDEQRCEKIRWCSTLKDVPHFLVECETTFGMGLIIYCFITSTKEEGSTPAALYSSALEHME